MQKRREEEGRQEKGKQPQTTVVTANTDLAKSQQLGKSNKGLHRVCEGKKKAQVLCLGGKGESHTRTGKGGGG